MGKDNAINITDEQFLEDIACKALRAGATDAQVRGTEGTTFGVKVRQGDIDGSRHAEGVNLQVTVYIGKRRASLGTNRLHPLEIEALVERVIQIAKIAPEDPFCGLPPREFVASRSDTALKLSDPDEPSPHQLLDWSRAIEEAALTVPGVTMSDGSGFSWSRRRSRVTASNGLSHLSLGTAFSAHASVIAGAGERKEAASASRDARWRGDLPALDEVGAEAGKSAAMKVGSRKIPTTRAPVVFDRRIAFAFLSPFLQAINGVAIARGTSFLKNHLNRSVFGSAISIVDNPSIPRALGSRVIDGDGIAARKRTIIDGGVLKSWFLDWATAQQLKAQRTDHAGEPSNLTLMPGAIDQNGLLKEARAGLLVTQLFGQSLNPNSGEWSVGVTGSWFESGTIAFPVSEVTVAGNLLDLYREVVAGSDLENRSAANSPSLLVPQMSIGGS